MKEPQPRLVRWIIELNEYDYSVEYKIGKHNVNANAPSHIPLEDKTETTRRTSLFFMSVLNLIQLDEQMKGQNLYIMIKWKEKHEQGYRVKCILNINYLFKEDRNDF